jgi:hypothetical protein
LAISTWALITVLPVAIGAQEVVLHPTPEYLASVRVEARIEREFASASESALGRMATLIRSATRVDSFGRADGQLAEVIGLISDGTVSREGRVAIIDMANRSLRVLNQQGRQIARVGQAGGGPLDFRTPVGVWFAGESQLVVVDAVNGLKRVRIGDDGRAELVNSMPLNAGPMSGCALGDTLYLQGTAPVTSSETSDSRRTDFVVTGYDARSGGRWGFGDSYPSNRPLVRRLMSEGVVGCGGAYVLVALSKLPFISGFDPTGRRQWTSQLAEFDIGRSEERLNSRGQLSIGLEPDFKTFSFIRRITPIGGAFFVVQVGLATRESLRDGSLWSRVDSYVVDARNGTGTFVGVDLPLILGLAGDRLIGFENDPFPRVVFLRLAGSVRSEGPQSSRMGPLEHIH